MASETPNPDEQPTNATTLQCGVYHQAMVYRPRSGLDWVWRKCKEERTTLKGCEAHPDGKWLPSDPEGVGA